VDSKLMGQGASFQSKKANTTFKVAYLIWAGPPSLPSFAALYSVISPPPPPPENGKSDSDVTQKVIEKVSFGVVVIMFGTFTMCLYLFFSPQLLRAAYHISGGKIGRLGPKHTRVPGVEPAAEGSFPVAKKKKGEGEQGDGMARVSVETQDLTHTRRLDVSECTGVNSLKSLIFREFGTLLKGVRLADTALFCLAPVVEDDGGGRADSDEQLMWCIITDRSDAAQVLKCTSFRLVGEMDEEEQQQITVAFEKRRAGQPEPSRRSGGGKACGLTIREDGESSASRSSERSKRSKSARGRSQRRLAYSAPPSCAMGEDDDDREGGSRSPSEDERADTTSRPLMPTANNLAALGGGTRQPHCNRAPSVHSAWDDEGDARAPARKGPQLDDLL